MTDSERAAIDVRRRSERDPFEFDVLVRDRGGETHHRVALSRATHAALAGGRCSPEDCVRAAFAFLLDREPKEHILRQFDLALISRYFPEFERDLPRYLPERAGET